MILLARRQTSSAHLAMVTASVAFFKASALASRSYPGCDIVISLPERDEWARQQIYVRARCVSVGERKLGDGTP